MHRASEGPNPESFQKASGKVSGSLRGLPLPRGEEVTMDSSELSRKSKEIAGDHTRCKVNCTGPLPPTSRSSLGGHLWDTHLREKCYQKQKILLMLLPLLLPLLLPPFRKASRKLSG